MSQRNQKYARRYAGLLGLEVFALRPRSKKPATEHGYKDSTRDLAEIDRMFQGKPELNLAIPVGTCSGFFVLDVDPRNQGHHTLRKLEAELGPLPETVTVETAGGGLHFYFNYPLGFDIKKDTRGKTFGPGLDVISDGGYVAVPPSKHPSGERYKFRKGLSILEFMPADLPDAWLEYLARDSLAEEKLPAPSNDIIREGARNTTLAQVAGSLRRSGLGETAILAALSTVNRDRCRPPLDESEVAKIAASIANYPAHDEDDNRDLGYRIARETLHRHFGDGAHLIHCPMGFFHYVGTHWVRIDGNRLEGLILDVTRSMPTVKKGYSSVIRETIALLRAMCSRDDDPFCHTSEPPPVINCRNGEVWLKDDGTVELRPHRPDSYLLHCLPVDYDPAATCPTFDRAVLGIFKRASDPEDMMRHFNELGGYIIQPRRNHAVFVILFGAGSNGKTTLASVISRLLGPEMVYAGRIEELESDRFSIGYLVGKLMFMDDDVRTGVKLPDGVLKKISEAKQLTGEVKFKDKFNFVCRVVPLLLCNNVPSLTDLSPGLLRRLQVIPMNRKFRDSKKNKQRFQKVWAEEMSGVLNRFIQGWCRLQQRGCFDLPKDMIAARKEWLSQANPLEAFIAEECVVDPKRSCLVRDFYDEYCTWAKAAGITRTQQRINMKRNMLHLGYALKRSSQGEKFTGIALRSQCAVTVEL
ncbi:MAG: phage/plasmid primase, P4 family [Bacillota bacterium]